MASTELPEQKTARPPLLVRRSPFFYGWLILCLTFTSSMITTGISGYGISFFVVPMSEALGVSRAEFSSVSLLRLAVIPIVPFVGVMLDKREGPRLVLTVGGLLAGLALIATSQVQAMWQFYLSFGAVYSVVSIIIGWQLLGPSVLSKWFVRLRGRAMGISAIGVSMGGFVIAPIAGLLVAEVDWRSAWIVLGVGMIVVLVPAGALLMRRQPSDVGLRPDGVAPTNGNVSADAADVGRASSPPAVVAEEYPWTVREASRTWAFWALVMAQMLGQASLGATLFHQVAFMQDKGFDIREAALVATMVAGFAIPSKLVYGFLAERFHVRWVLAAAMMPAGLCLLILIVTGSREMLLTYAVLYGLTMGGYIPMVNVALAHYFGRENIGSIRGAMTPATSAAAAVSPFAVGAMWQWFNNYDVAFVLLGAGWFVGGLFVLLASRPRAPVGQGV